MKKKLIAILMTSAMALSLAACGGGSSSSSAPVAAPSSTPAASSDSGSSDAGDSGSSDSASGGTTITYMASQDWVQDAEMELAQKFEEETGIHVDFQIIPSDQYETVLMTGLNTGECTDIFGGQSSCFSIVTQFDVEKNAVDLSGESWAGNVEPAAAYELSVNGKLYGQPVQDVSACWAVAYNRAIFDELGLSVPNSFDEFCTVCDKIMAAGKIPVYEAVPDGWHHVCWLEGAVAATKADSSYPDRLNNHQDTFAGNAQLKTMLTQMQTCVDRGYWGSDQEYMANEYANAPSAIAAGEYVMVLYNQGLGVEVNAIDPSFPVDNIGYFAIPFCDNKNLNVNPCGPSRFIYSGSQNIDAAKKYLEYMASDESLAYMTENVGKFNKLPYTNAPSAYTPVIQEFYDKYPEQIAVFQASVKYFNPQWMEMGADLSAMYLGDMNEDEVLASIDKRRDDQAAAAADPAWN